MRELSLPPCGDLPEAGGLLTAEERRSLLMHLAHHGEGSLEDWVRERAEEDPRWRDRAQELREEVERELERRRSSVEDELSTRREQLEAAHEERTSHIRERRGSLQERLADVRERRGRVLREALDTSKLTRLAGDPDPDLTLWQRFVAWFGRWWRRTVRWFKRLLGIGGGTHEVHLTAPGGEDSVDLDVALALERNPAFAREVRKRLRQDPVRERLKRLRDRLLGRQDYEEVVADLVREEVEEEVREREEQVEAREEDITEDLEEVQEEEREARREARRARRELERRRREAEEEIARRAEEEPLEHLAGRVQGELRDAGLVTGDGSPTGRLLRTLSELLFEATVKGLEGTEATPMSRPQGSNVQVEKHPLVTLEERNRVDLLESLVRARTRHPSVRHLTDQDLVVMRTTEPRRAHVVLVTDVSGSMEEGDRLGAAKRATMALHGAVERDDPAHTVNVVLMETDVHRASLGEVWDATPRAFTNVEGALDLTRRLLLRDPAEVPMLVLVTDGLPEAVMDGGEGRAAHPGEARAHAVEAAKRLKREVPELHATILLLEPEDELYVEAAEELAEVLEGEVLETRPEDLAADVLRGWGRGLAEDAQP